MNFIAREVVTDQNVQKTAGIKARDDVEKIAVSSGFHVIDINLPDENERRNVNALKKIWYHRYIQSQWDRCLAQAGTGDCVLIQFPVIHHSLLFNRTIRLLKKRGVKVVLLIHDLEMLRWSKRATTPLKMKLRLNAEEKSILKAADYVIAHNEIMKSQLIEFGVKDDHILVLGIFDYLIEGSDNHADASADGPIVIAGNLRAHKAGYAYHLPQNQKYNLYGVGYEDSGKENVHYFGSFMPDELPGHLSGSFGLVWDGDSTETCSGAYGEYLKINNPHKTSLYLASGLPAVIWKEAALAGFVSDNNCGFTVSSLPEISEKMNSLNPEDYMHMKKAAAELSGKLRNGYYTRCALEQCGIKLEGK